MKNDWTAKANNFDFIRLALAVLVIYSHSFPLGTGSEVSEPIRIFTRGQMTGGAIAVDLFFIMSGFLISASAERSSGILSYLHRRVARIYPAFIVSAVLTAALVVPFISAHIVGASPITRFGDFLLQTLRLREFDYTGAFPTNPYPIAINGSVWSIQYEFWCYLGVALLLSVGLLRKRAVLLSLFFASVGVSVAFQVEGWIFGGKWLGILMGSPQLWVRLLPLYLAGVVFYLAFAPQLNLRRAGRFGDFSYGTYLYAFPIMQLLMRSIGHPVAPLFLFACATPLTLLAAIASWYGVERRFLRPGRRKETFEAAIDTRPTPAATLNRA